MRAIPVILRSRAAGVDRRALRRLLDDCLDSERVDAGTGVSLVLAGDRLVRRLNAQWRGRDRVTDVLSFPEGNSPPLPPEATEDRSVGEVIVSLPQCLRQAAERGEDPGVELVRLVVHGFLHCLGHDHEKPEERARMTASERRLRARARRAGLGSGLVRVRRSRHP